MRTYLNFQFFQGGWDIENRSARATANCIFKILRVDIFFHKLFAFSFEWYRDGCEILSAAILAFQLRLRQVAQKGFLRSSTTVQTFLLTFLVSLKNLKFRDERISQPSYTIFLTNSSIFDKIISVVTPKSLRFWSCWYYGFYALIF